ncbi:8-amino-7-oxononanoate synthase [Synechococcales cyanobacterium C]|uniref:8-amino-7-ketopelargonate synthase n=2 Tax=Petrachloros TaxID=2918834 RepID=A0A8K2A2I7_9CYAN|nr:8-amino-7-oxononanoate synthase [Petrachloros mirabilis ULC683]
MASALHSIHHAHWYRQVQPITTAPGSLVQRSGCTVVNFASNDYLGLAGDPRLREAAIAALYTWGSGSTGSRLLSGHRPIHTELEQALADWKQTEAALVFSSGYLANLGTIAALVGPRDLIMADQYNHASLKNGARLSGATVITYRHRDSEDLHTQLQQQRQRHRRCLILTDSVFSMDGDLCPLPELLDLATEFDSMVLVDEAHGTGVLGATGAGGVEHLGCSGAPMIQVGTLSKALGSLGGYVAGSAVLIDYLRNRASSWIYTTGLSPADTAAALAALRIAQSEPERRARLWENVTHLQRCLQKYQSQGLDPRQILPSDSAILCLQFPNPVTVLQVSQRLLAEGIWAPAIRPPTVPTSRIRISVMTTHSPDQIEQLAFALATCP